MKKKIKFRRRKVQKTEYIPEEKRSDIPIIIFGIVFCIMLTITIISVI